MVLKKEDGEGKVEGGLQIISFSSHRPLFTSIFYFSSLSLSEVIVSDCAHCRPSKAQDLIGPLGPAVISLSHTVAGIS